MVKTKYSNWTNDDLDKVFYGLCDEIADVYDKLTIGIVYGYVIYVNPELAKEKIMRSFKEYFQEYLFESETSKMFTDILPNTRLDKDWLKPKDRKINKRCLKIY